MESLRDPARTLLILHREPSEKIEHPKKLQFSRKGIVTEFSTEPRPQRSSSPPETSASKLFRRSEGNSSLGFLFFWVIFLPAAEFAFDVLLAASLRQ